MDLKTRFDRAVSSKAHFRRLLDTEMANVNRIHSALEEVSNRASLLFIVDISNTQIMNCTDCVTCSFNCNHEPPSYLDTSQNRQALIDMRNIKDRIPWDMGQEMACRHACQLLADHNGSPELRHPSNQENSQVCCGSRKKSTALQAVVLRHFHR